MTLNEEIYKFKNLKKSVKLHLGCGPNVFEDWINVDGDYCAGQPGVTIHNLTDTYPVLDNSVDEILSVHVIEHIMPDKVPPMLKEWHRILKPGGFVATEWPDILKMCKFIVDDPSRLYSDNRKILKQGIAGIFGNIVRYQDVAMMHKWGYSIDSLSKLLREAGFSKIIAEPNKYPKTAMCSRVVAYK
jgi:predicted SAM-dependent methyltransferase